MPLLIRTHILDGPPVLPVTLNQIRISGSRRSLAAAGQASLGRADSLDQLMDHTPDNAAFTDLREGTGNISGMPLLLAHLLLTGGIALPPADPSLGGGELAALIITGPPALADRAAGRTAPAAVAEHALLLLALVTAEIEDRTHAFNSNTVSPTLLKLKLLLPQMTRISLLKYGSSTDF